MFVIRSTETLPRLSFVSRAALRALVGNDVYDTGHDSRGCPRFPNNDFVVARKHAREWLARREDAYLIGFSLEKTIDDHARAMLHGSREWSSAECDVLNDVCQRASRLRDELRERQNLMAGLGRPLTEEEDAEVVASFIAREETR